MMIMFHTTLLFQSLKSVDFPIVSSHLASLSKEHSARHYTDPDFNDLHIYELYKEQGIIIMLRRTRISRGDNTQNITTGDSSEGIYYHAIEIRLNPKVLIKKNEYVQVAKHSDYKAICQRFKAVSQPLQENYEIRPGLCCYWFNSINSYQIKRIDYCVNITTEMHATYIELIRRADVPPHFHFVKVIDKKTDKEILCKNSFYVQTKNHSVGINFYNKEYQMHKEFPQYENLNDAKNIIRLEIQCMTGKTNSLKQKYGWRYRDLINFIDDDLARKTIYSYYEKSVGFEDYYTLEEAKHRIQLCNYKKRPLKI